MSDKDKSIKDFWGGLLFLFVWYPMFIFGNPYVFMTVWNWMVPHIGMMEISYPVAFIMMSLFYLIRNNPVDNLKNNKLKDDSFSKDMLANTMGLLIGTVIYWDVILISCYIASTFLE